MKPKAHILVVEDKSIIYKRFKMFLTDENYSVDEFTPSVKRAIAKINAKRPDIVLLDIDLQGEQTGIELGELLSLEYHIPFIYVTDYDDSETFYKGLATQHEQYVVKTKPHLNIKEVLRAIQTVLARNENNPTSILKDAIIGFVDYINNTKDKGKSDISNVPVKFTDIAFFTTNSSEVDEKKTKERGKQCFIKLKPNYTRFETWDKEPYYLPISLRKLYGKLPKYFVQTSEDFIVNVSNEMLDGAINGSRLKVRDTIYSISKNYKSEVKKRLELLYLNVK